METGRLILRRWRSGDVAPFAEMGNDPKVMEFYPSLLSTAESEAFIQRAEKNIEKNGFGLWAAEIKETGAFIGYVGLNIPAFEAAFTPCVEIGWRLAKAYWGKGYATEAAHACLRYAFDKAGLEEVLSWTYTGNHRSRKVMERLGMEPHPLREFAHPLLAEGHPLRPHVLYRITRARYNGSCE